MNALAPVNPSERVWLVDALRGFALAGVLLVNMQRYVEDLPGVANRLADVCIDLLASGKFYPLFALLFGVGFSVQRSRARELGAPFIWMYLRRSAVLLCMGITLYVTLERNDILIAYAVLGLPLLLVRRATGPLLLGVAVLSLACAVSVGVIMEMAQARNPTERDNTRQEVASELARARRVFEQGSYSELVLIRGEILVNQTRRPEFFAPWFHYFAMFLLGWYAERTGVFRAPQHFRHPLWVGCGAGFAAGLFLGGLQVFGHRVAPAAFWTPGVVAGVTVAAGTALAVAYASTLTLAWQCRGVPAWLRPLALAGRMSLTNFVLQYVAMTALFHHYGFGLYKHVGSAASIGITGAIYVTQLALSGLWLTYFKQGPLEWLWRSLTYGKPAELRV